MECNISPFLLCLEANISSHQVSHNRILLVEFGSPVLHDLELLVGEVGRVVISQAFWLEGHLGESTSGIDARKDEIGPAQTVVSGASVADILDLTIESEVDRCVNSPLRNH